MISKTEKREKIQGIPRYADVRARRITLSGQWNRCPEYWRNFVRSFRFEDGFDDRTAILDAALVKWQVTREYNENGESVLIFATEADYTMFLLRWA